MELELTIEPPCVSMKMELERFMELELLQFTFQKEFQIQNGEIINSDVQAIQITHGQSYDLNTNEAAERELANESQPEVNFPYYQVFATSETILSRTIAVLDEAVSKERLNGKIIVITEPSNNKINQITFNFLRKMVILK